MNETKEQEVRADYGRITKLLIRRKMTVTTMESCTSGQLASLITDTEGASAVFSGADVTYSNETKIMAGVPAEIIEKYSVYSRETAAAMAAACRRKYRADLGIGITGSFGNADPANPGASVPGEIFFAVENADGVQTFFRKLPADLNRREAKLAAAHEVSAVLICMLENGERQEEESYV